MKGKVSVKGCERGDVSHQGFTVTTVILINYHVDEGCLIRVSLLQP